MAENVNEQIQVPEEQVRKAEHFWEDPQTILRLLDLLFLYEDSDTKQVCS